MRYPPVQAFDVPTTTAQRGTAVAVKSDLNCLQLKSILLVDDDLDDQLFFHLVLKDVSSEFHFTNVNSADELFKRLEPESNYSPYVIFLDLNLPLKSGLECLADLKANEQWKDIAVVVYSTSNDSFMIDEAYKGGATYYICKPNSLDELDGVLRDILSKELSGKVQPDRTDFVYCPPYRTGNKL